MEGEIDWKWLRVDATMLHVQNDMRQRVGWEIDVDEGENEKLGVWACMCVCAWVGRMAYNSISLFAEHERRRPLVG